MLKEYSIVPLGVGVGDAQHSELEMIAFKPDLIYKFTDFTQLPSVQSQLVAALNIKEIMTGISDFSRKELHIWIHA